MTSLCYKKFEKPTFVHVSERAGKKINKSWRYAFSSNDPYTIPGALTVTFYDPN